jgi:hypothetical protein
MRLSFCYPTPENIRVGIRRLATVIRGELDLLDTFAGTGPLDSRRDNQRFGAPPPNIS